MKQHISLGLCCLHFVVGFLQICASYNRVLPVIACTFTLAQWHDAHIGQKLHVLQVHCKKWIVPGILCWIHCNCIKYFVPGNCIADSLYLVRTSPWHNGMTRILGRRLTEASSRHRAMFSLLGTGRQ